MRSSYKLQAASCKSANELEACGLRLLFSDELVGAGKDPGPGDAEDVGVLGDVGRKRRVRRREVDDAQRGRVEYPVAGRPVDVHALERAVRLDRHGDYQAAVDALVARGLRVIDLADALDLDAPVLDVAGEAIFLGAGADEAAARALLVAVPFARDARLEPRDLHTAAHDLGGVRCDLRLFLGLRDIRHGDDLRLGFRLRHELLRFALQLLDALLRLGDIR